MKWALKHLLRCDARRKGEEKVFSIFSCNKSKNQITNYGFNLAYSKASSVSDNIICYWEGYPEMIHRI